MTTTTFLYRCRTIKTPNKTPRSLKIKNCQHRFEERQYCWNCNSRLSPRCAGRRASRHLARSVSMPPTRNVHHQSVPCIRSKSMPYREKDSSKMPTKFECSSIKTCFSLSSLHPSTVNVEGGQQAAQRPYNSLTKKIKKNETTNQDCWRGDSSFEFLSSLRTSYQYLMDNNLIESCREVGYDLNNTSPIQDWNVERLNIYIQELEKSFCSGSASKANHNCSLPENLLSPKRLSMSEEVRRLNILRHIAQLSKRLPHCREPSMNQSYSSIYNTHYLEVKSNLRTLDQWLAQMEARLKPNYFRVNWNRREIRQKAEEHKSIHSDIETKGKCIRSVLKYSKWLADEQHQSSNPVHQELVQTVPILIRKAKHFEHRWQLLYIRSLEWICFIESLTVKKCRKDSNSSSDCDEEPVHKCPRLVDDDKLSSPIDDKELSCEMETETSPSSVLQSERVSFDDTANFHRSDRKGPNLATFYYRHLDTDSEQESQKKQTVEAEVKTSESSEEEWTYSSNTAKEVKKPEMPVSLAERANSEEIKALVENVNWSVSKNKNAEKLWLSGIGVKKRSFRHENIDPENEEFIGDSCDASGEYTTEDDDQHFSSDNHSHSSRSCDITVVQSPELDFSSSPGNINDCSSPKVVLRSKTKNGNALRPVSMSGLPQSTPKARLLTESCQLSVSESALNQFSHEQVSVNGRDSSTIEESTATQTQDCCGSYNTNSLRRRKLKHRRKSTQEKKSKGGSVDSLSSAVNSTAYNEMVTSDTLSGSLCGIPQTDSQRVDSETEEDTAKESKRPVGRKRPMKMPVFRLGEFGAVTPREKRFPLTAQLPSGTTTDFSSFSEQAWDSYQEKYLSEPYSEDPPDPESVRRLLDFGDDYRKYIDSQSDCASSIGRPSFLDDETFEQDSSDSVRKLIIRSRLQLNYLQQVLDKLVMYPNSHITISDIGQLKQRCRENEYCLRFCLEGIKDSNTNVSANEVAEIESMVKKCELLELGITKQEKIQLLKTDIAAIKSRLLSFSRNDWLDSNVQNKNELQALLHTAKTELSNLDTYWNGRNIVSITEELNRHFNEMNDSTTVLNHMNKEVADLYSIYANTRQRLESEISRYQNALITLVECDKQLMELEMKFKGFGGDDGSIGGNPKSGCFGSISDSGMSDSGSEHELNEHEKRLVNLKQLANNLMTIMTPGSEALTSILARIENNEKQLKELQQTCKDLMGRTEIRTDEDRCDGNENIVETNIVDVATAAEDANTPLKKIKDNTALLWRTLRIAVPFYLAVMILCSVGWLEPQCCDLQNNYKWSFALGLRYMNGPPPT
ncbi:KASH domain [Cinara cedri]|uniref:KASH domain n=1 Tax=Cinara cedri TaxID=506608 RepID=A0A5E4NI37_9HEMI|nr:KASH domain [Cinara cedri]